MTRRKEPDVTVKRCAGPECTNDFAPARSTARYCSATCRQRAARARKAAEAQARDAATDDTDAEHGLVKAVRKELDQAQATETVAGQLALAVARRIAKPDEPGISALSKELRSLIAEAKGAAPSGPSPDPPPAPEDDDEVAEARRRREEIAAAAAGGEA